MIARSAPPYRRLAAFACALLVSLLWLGAGSASALDVTVTASPYSARGDGVTNDRAAIQSAIDAVNSAGGGTVTVPGTRTYLTGGLILKSNVTLELAAGATILQSQDPAHWATTTWRGRQVPGSTIPYVTYLDMNYPLIYAGNARNVHIRGSGTIDLSYALTERDSIIVHGIGTHYVDGFSVRGITIANASAYNVTIRNSDNVEISGIRAVTPRTFNSDGISLMNSSRVEVFDNDLTTLDDGIYLWASYDDPRRSAWWNSDTPRPSRDIHIYNNVVDNQAWVDSHAFVFINWTNAAPDASRVEISRVNVHDNVFRGPVGIGVLENDIYHAGGAKTPSKWLRFARNRFTVTGSWPVARDLDTMATTDLSVDDPLYNFGVSSNREGVYNWNFDAANAFPAQFGTSFWSTEGTGTASNASVGQPGGWFGEINRFSSGYSSITQGVHLEPGTYTLSAATQSSGATVHLLAVQASPMSVLRSLPFTNRSWTTNSITFDVTTAGNVRLGIDNGGGGGATDFGRIDDMRLVKIR